jgi:DNA-binding CsgD family transcriptional regulator
MRNDSSQLSKSDLIVLHELARESLSVRNRADVNEVLTKLCAHLPTDGVVGGLLPQRFQIAEPQHVSFVLRNVVLANVSRAGYSDEWLEEYRRNGYFSCDPTKSARIAGADFQSWTEAFERPRNVAERRYVRQAAAHGVQNGVTIGACTASPGPLSFFSFLGRALEKDRRHEIFLRCAAPYLHEALRRSSAPDPLLPPTKDTPVLSAREIEVLNWIMTGKSNWDISRLLGVSEATVKFHVKNILLKLDVCSRAHAVAVAIGHGLIRSID